MTNSPPFDEQLAIAKYWQSVDPLTFLPGSINAADRFARVSFLINAIPKALDPQHDQGRPRRQLPRAGGRRACSA